jgi:hypothetical protein
MPQRL